MDSPTIPHSMLAHWSFPRQSIHEEMFRSPPLSTGERLFAYGIEKLARAVRLYDPIFRWGSFSALMGIVRWYFRIFNRFEIIGRNSIPDRAIFYVNHPGSLDSLLFLAAIGRAVACFIGYENYAFTQMLERLFNFINRDHHKKDWLIEKMIRIILQKNSHFAIWPEGRSPLDGRIMYGFSSVVKVYATLNSHRNIIPLVPVLIEGSGCYRYNLWPRTNKITLRFLPAYYLPREWLRKTDEGGKTPREIVDYMMNILAKARGQKRLLYNDRIDHHRQRYQKLDSQS